MFKMKEFFQRVKEKTQGALNDLKNNLIDQVGRQAGHSKSISKLKKTYLNSELPQISQTPQKINEMNRKNRNDQSRSVQAHSFSSKIRQGRKNSGNIHELPANQLKIKRDKLMSELKQIDIEMKNKHKDKYLSRVKRNKTQVQGIDKESHERAAKLVEKMNKQRSEMAQKKVKETIQLKQNVEQSLKRLQEMQQQRRQKEQKKKQQIQRRMQARKLKAFQRDRVNRISNQLIKEISSYKIHLPDIYLKNYQTSISHQGEYQQVLLTNVEEERKKSNSRVKDSRVTSFLENVHQEDLQRRKVSQKQKEYHRSVREKQVEFGQKVKQTQKLKLERSRSKNKISRARKPPHIQTKQMRIESHESQANTINNDNSIIGQACYQ